MKRPIRARSALALAATVTALAGAASTATASASAPSGASWACTPSVFDGFAALTAGARVNGDKPREPGLGEVAEEVPSSAKGRGGASFSATIPVYVHVISRDGVEGDVPLSTIRQQIHVLNMTFGGFEGGFATGFAFRLQDVDRTVNAVWFDAAPGSKGERDMKKALRRGGAESLNVYTTSGNAYLGWAYFPSTYKTRPYLDGIVIDYRSMPGGPYGDRYSLGETLTHEAGHWLGLYHTFQGGCNNWGDYVDDTPFMRVPTTGCPEGKDTCSEPGLDPIHNYMDYSYDSCYTEFTAGQAARMQDQYLFFRAAG